MFNRIKKEPSRELVPVDDVVDNLPFIVRDLFWANRPLTTLPSPRKSLPSPRKSLPRPP